MTPILAFDLETVPDLAGRSGACNDCRPTCPTPTSPKWYAQARRAADRRATSRRTTCNKVVAIACALRRDDDLKVWSVGEAGEGESRPDPALLRGHRDSSRRSS